MKVTCTSEQNFKPVTISITCETPEELFALWHRFNLLQAHVQQISNESNTSWHVPNGDFNPSPAWKLLHKEVQKLLK